MCVTDGRRHRIPSLDADLLAGSSVRYGYTFTDHWIKLYTTKSHASAEVSGKLT